MIMGNDDAPGVLAPSQCAPPKDKDSVPSFGLAMVLHGKIRVQKSGLMIS
jgi:hypothetical protein